MFVSCFFSVTNILLTDHLTRRNIQIHHLQPQKGWRNTCVLMMKKNGLFLCESRMTSFEFEQNWKLIYVLKRNPPNWEIQVWKISMHNFGVGYKMPLTILISFYQENFIVHIFHCQKHFGESKTSTFASFDLRHVV